MKGPLFYAKILLFGEYGIIKDSKGLAIPYNCYKGALKSASNLSGEAKKSNENLVKLYDYLKKTSTDLVSFNFTAFKEDIDTGMYFDSSIPQGYGVGSSGALVASIYDQYAEDKITILENLTRDKLLKLKDILKERFPEYHFPEREFSYISTIDVDNAYAYKYKSFVRTSGGFISDFFKLHLKSFWDRLLVLLRVRKDPYNTFEHILALSNTYKVKVIFFFLIADYTTFDTNVSTTKRQFRLLIKHIADYASIGLHPSYYTMKNSVMLKKEKERLESITNIPTTISRQHFLRFSLPETYQNLIDLEINEDYSMGYASHVGFRAGTSIPFHFFDLDFEIQTPLLIYPFALMDTTLNDYMGLTPKQSLGRTKDLLHEVMKVKGTFITLFHNESVSGYLRWNGWQRVYETMLKMIRKNAY